MVRIFDKSQLKTDCENCDAVCCVATKFKLPHYYKPPRTPCQHLDQAQGSCTIFNRLDSRSAAISIVMAVASQSAICSKSSAKIGQAIQRSRKFSFTPSASSISSSSNISTPTAPSRSTCPNTSSKNSNPSPNRR